MKTATLLIVLVALVGGAQGRQLLRNHAGALVAAGDSLQALQCTTKKCDCGFAALKTTTKLTTRVLDTEEMFAAQVGDLKVLNMHLSGDGPKGKSIVDFLKGQGITQSVLEKVDVLAGDTNITPLKLKDGSEVTVTTDLSGEIATALKTISGKGDDWTVYMANAVVGKRRLGYALMNTQVYKSEDSAKPANPEFDGSIVAVRTRDVDKIEIVGEKDAAKGYRVGTSATEPTVGGTFGLNPRKNVEACEGNKCYVEAFKFVAASSGDVADYTKITTGTVFLDHAVLEIKLPVRDGEEKKNALVLNVGSVIDVKYKNWGVDGPDMACPAMDGGTYQWFDHELLDGISTLKQLDAKLYAHQKEVFGLGSMKYTHFNGYGKVVQGIMKLKPKAKFPPEAEDGKTIDQMAELAGAKIMTFLKEVKANAKQYFNEKVIDKELKSNAYEYLSKDKEQWEKDFAQKLEEAKENKWSGKSLLKLTGEFLVKVAGFGQPFGGFGDQISEIKPAALQKLVSPKPIYEALRAAIDNGKVIIGSEMSSKRLRNCEESGCKKDVCTDKLDTVLGSFEGKPDETPKPNSPKGEA